jgi:hypothetical protein
MVKIGENWKCPYCGHAQVLSEDRLTQRDTGVSVKGWKVGSPLLHHFAVACANADCQELTLKVTLMTTTGYEKGGYTGRALVKSFALLPSSYAKPQPDYIPQPLRDDYNEACAIRDLSPKASATLTRRCLQGMIRDFCGISKRRLIDEINQLRTAVEDGKAPAGVQPDAVEAIDHVRGIGNIGAHMEADIDVIVDVDPGEAQALTELVELLFLEWYVARNQREARLSKLKGIATDKKAQTSGKAVVALQGDPKT